MAEEKKSASKTTDTEERTAKKVKKEEIEIVDEEEVEEVGGYKTKKKPVLDAETKNGLKTREKINKKRPKFKRQEWYTYKRLGDSWRRPRGLHSKMRKHLKYRPNVVSIGY